MRTTLDIESDVLDTAKALAAARGVSVGAALSELARRGVAARTPLSTVNGFPVFQVQAGTPSFGPDEVAAALESEDAERAREFLTPGR
ncbi:MAG: antitoxin [Bryobacterales bacterium]|nr:antitoxin [Bryobacterales bacterium]